MKISAKQFTLKRLLALVCVLVLSITAIQWPIGKAEAAAENVTAITINILDGITYYDIDGTNIKEALKNWSEDGGTSYTTGDVDNPSYKYEKTDDGKYKVTPAEGGNFKSKTRYLDVFYLKVNESKLDKSSLLINGSQAPTEWNSPIGEVTPDYKIRVSFARESTGEIGIILSADPKKYSVTFPDCNGQNYTITDEGDRTFGDLAVKNYSSEETVKFKVKLNNEVLPDSVDILVRAQGASGTEVLSPEKGVYSLAGLTENKTILVAVTPKMYSVTGVEDGLNYKAYSMASSNRVAYGGSYEFYVKPDDGYDYPAEGEVSIKGDGATLNRYNEGRYVISGITSNITIHIGEVKQMSRTITYNTGIGYEFYQNAEGSSPFVDNTDNVNYNQESYPFYVKVNEDYSQSAANMSVTANNKKLTGTKVENEGSKDVIYQYEIKNVTEDQIISVSGLTKNIYDVTLEQNEKYTISTTQNTRVSAGDKLSFIVTPAAGFQCINSPKAVYTDGTEKEIALESLGNGSYRGTTEEIKSDITIKMKDDSVEEITFKITVNDNDDQKGKENHSVTDESGHSYNITYYKPEGIEDQSFDIEQVKYGTPVKFSVEPVDPGYVITQVAVDGSEVRPVDGKYTIANITANHDIYVATTELSLTINYIDAKHTESIPEGSSTIWYHDGGFSQDGIYTLNGSKVTDNYYDFIGWFKEGAVDKTVQINRSELGIGNTLTLTAKWQPKWDKFATVETKNGSVTQKDKLYQVMYENLVKFVAGLEEEGDYEPADIKVTGYGILYSDDEFTPRERTYLVTGRTEGSFGYAQQYWRNIPTEHLVNYYINLQGINVEEFVNAHPIEGTTDQTKFTWRFDSKSPTDHWGAGWIELTIGEGDNAESMVIIADTPLELPLKNQ